MLARYTFIQQSIVMLIFGGVSLNELWIDR